MAAKKGRESTEAYLVPATLVVLNFVGQTGQLASVPYLSLAAGLVSQIVQTVQDVKDNKDAFFELAADADSLVAGIWHSYETSLNKESWPPQGLKDVLVELESTLRDIHKYAEQMGKRKLVQRIVQSKLDPGKVKRYHEKLALHVSKFEIHSHINLNEAVSQIISSQRAAGQELHEANQARVEAAAQESVRKAMEILTKHIAFGASYDSAARGDVPACHPETRRSIIEEIMDWVKNPESLPFLWMHGPAGCGKTTIMQSIAEICDGAGLLAASFFFSRSAADRPKEKTCFVPTLVDQMCLSIPEIRQQIVIALNHDPRIFSKTLMKQIEHLMIKPLNKLSDLKPSDVPPTVRPCFIIVDGLDECEGTDSQTEVLEVLTTAANRLTSRFIFLVASRPEHDIRNKFSTSSMSSLTHRMPLDNDYRACSDIRTYLESQFEEIKKNHPGRASLPEKWPSGTDLDYLVKKASGQFIYASVVIEWVATSHRLPTRQLDQIITVSPSMASSTEMPFAQLDTLYTHILSSLDPENLQKALEIFRWIITDPDLYNYSGGTLGSQVQTPDVADKLFLFRPGESEIALDGLKALVKFECNYDSWYYTQPDVYFLHASFPDFLLDRSRSGKFFLDSPNIHTNLARHWINYYSNPLNTPPLKLPGKNAEYLTTIRIIQKIFSHCGNASLTCNLQDDLYNLDLGKSLTLIMDISWGDNKMLFLILNFIIWLESQTFPDPNRNLHQHYLQQLQTFIQEHWSNYHPAIREHFPIALTLPDKDFAYEHCSMTNVIYLMDDAEMRGHRIFDPLKIRLLSIQACTVCDNIKELAGNTHFHKQTKVLLCQILTEFQLPMDGDYFMDGRLYTKLVISLVQSFLASVEYFRMLILLYALQWYLSKASPDQELAILLLDMIPKSDILTKDDEWSMSWSPGRKTAAVSARKEFYLASLLYIHESKVSLRNHIHTPGLDPTDGTSSCFFCDAEEREDELSEDPVLERPVEADPRPKNLFARFNQPLDVLWLQAWLMWLTDLLRRLLFIY